MSKAIQVEALSKSFGHREVLHNIDFSVESGSLLLQLSPYHWAYGNSPVTNGADWSAAAGLWGISAVLVLFSALALQRRDVGA